MFPTGAWKRRELKQAEYLYQMSAILRITVTLKPENVKDKCGRQELLRPRARIEAEE